MMKRTHLFSTTLLLSLSLFLSSQTISSSQNLDEIAIIVDNQIITQQEWRSALNQARQEVATMPASTRPTPEQLEDEVFLNLAASKLQQKFARESGMTVSDQQVDEAIQDIASRNNATVAQLREYLAYIGQSYTDFREDIRGQILASMLQNEIVRDVDINESELEVYMNSKEFRDIEKSLLRDNTTQYKVKHILIKISPTLSEEQALSQIKRLRERIEAGEPFEEIASAQSQDPIAAAQQGSLGWVTKGQLAPEFEETMTRLTVGELSQPVKTVFGYHLILLEDRKTGVADEEMMRNIAREYYFRKKASQTYSLWIEKQIGDVYVEKRF